MEEELLFYSRAHLSAVLYAYPQQLARDVEETDRNRILNASLSDLVDHFVSKYFLDVPRLRRDEAHLLDPQDAKIDVSYDFSRSFREPGPHYEQGTLFTLVVPFDGDADLFSMQPSTFSMSGTRGSVQNGALVFRHQRLDHDGAAVKSDLDGRLGQVESHLETQRRDVHDWNSRLPETVRSLIEARKKKILDGLNLTESLGYPLKRRSASTYPVPLARKRILVQMPTPKTATYTPEPALAIQVYEDILQVISSLSVMMERSPSAFVSMSEEHLRDHILVILNGQFEGQATGETFNRTGKTDILIREKDRNLFIAECKFWDGPKSLTAAIDQVLSYTCWRDTKVAVIVFNRRKDISGVLAAVPKAASNHPCCKKQIDYKAEGGFRFLFGQKDDRNRELILTVLVFDVASAAADDAVPAPSVPQSAAPAPAPRRRPPEGADDSRTPAPDAAVTTTARADTAGCGPHASRTRASSSWSARVHGRCNQLEEGSTAAPASGLPEGPAPAPMAEPPPASCFGRAHPPERAMEQTSAATTARSLSPP